MLATFTLLTIPLDHDFWNMTGLAATQARLESEEHLTVIGGLIIVSIHSFLRGERGQSRRL
ncbi:MAG: DoxX family protein [Phenylobacterium sp.]|nr:DoxX family protein [Phenylobacterium sp.]